MGGVEPRATAGTTPENARENGRASVGSAAPVTIATVVQMAKDNGWRTNAGRDYALDWDSEISDRDELVVVERGWVESQEFHEPDS